MIAFELGDISAGSDFEQRHLTVRILGQELGRAALAREDVDLDQAIVNAELSQCQPHLVAVAGSLHRIERMHRLPSWRTVHC